ncbi:MAG TPA: Mov34/MPN/PAD-1 family protein [Thermoanaerobaculia bacterium]|nr:Mov34/MPN/PAD-1 family protein [Thermoanaerobaculia bacterium]
MRRFLLAVHRDGGELVARVAASIDWEPAREWVRFLAVRRGWLRPGEEAGRVVIAPRWHGEIGRPYAAAFRLRLTLPGRPALTVELPASYLRDPAVAAVAALREAGQLSAGDGYSVFAVVAEGERELPMASSFAVETASPEVPLLPGSQAALAERATPADEPAAEGDDVRCLIAEEVLAEAAKLAAAAAPHETGGALLGHLRRDQGSDELYLEVTAQLPATRAVADTARLTFTAEAWTEVSAALERRMGGEILLGWWHSHPLADWYRGEGEEGGHRTAVTALAAAGFLSAQDRALHRVVFPRAWSVALLVTLTDGGPRLRLFGWRRGQVEPRGFDRLRPAGARAQEASHVA